MFHIGNPQYQYLFLLPILVWFTYVFYRSWRNKKRAALADDLLWNQIHPNRSKRKPILKQIFRLLGLTSLVIALLNPKIGTRVETVTRKGVDVVFAVDVSKSMLAEDVSPSRLLKAKQILSKSIDGLVNDRIGVIVYAGKAYAQLPLTTDYNAAKMFLRTIDTDIVPTQGTDVGKAVEMALSYFESGDQKNRVLFILSDGESHEKGALKASDLASDNGIIIHSIGLGTPEGAPIPIKSNGFVKSYKKDKNDQVVVTRLDPEMLQQLAVSTGGAFINGSNTNDATTFVQNALSKMEKVESETEMFTDYEDQFQWFLAFSLFFFILDLILPNRKTLWIRKFKLFG